VEHDPLGRVEVASLRAVVGQVQGADGQYRPHDVVALEADLDDGHAPEVAHAWVDGEGRVRQGGEVVEELELEQGEVFVALRVNHGRSWRC